VVTNRQRALPCCSAVTRQNASGCRLEAARSDASSCRVAHRRGLVNHLLYVILPEMTVPSIVQRLDIRRGLELGDGDETGLRKTSGTQSLDSLHMLRDQKPLDSPCWTNPQPHRSLPGPTRCSLATPPGGRTCRRDPWAPTSCREWEKLRCVWRERNSARLAQKNGGAWTRVGHKLK
jgi:hypothetical protein